MDHLHLIIDYGVIGLLLLLSLVACAVAIERWLVFRATRVTDFVDRRELELHLTNKLHLIATIGETGFDTTRIMRGLSMALKATALGLLVAIPAVTLYNLLLRRCKVLLLKWDIAHGREGV